MSLSFTAAVEQAIERACPNCGVEPYTRLMKVSTESPQASATNHYEWHGCGCHPPLPDWAEDELVVGEWMQARRTGSTAPPPLATYLQRAWTESTTIPRFHIGNGGKTLCGFRVVRTGGRWRQSMRAETCESCLRSGQFRRFMP